MFFGHWRDIAALPCFQNRCFARSPENFCDIFFEFVWKFRFEKWRGSLVNFIWSPFPTKRSTKTPQKIQWKFGAEFGKNSGRKFEKFGELSFCNFSDLKIRSVFGHVRASGWQQGVLSHSNTTRWIKDKALQTQNLHMQIYVLWTASMYWFLQLCSACSIFPWRLASGEFFCCNCIGAKRTQGSRNCQVNSIRRALKQWLSSPKQFSKYLYVCDVLGQIGTVTNEKITELIP